MRKVSISRIKKEMSDVFYLSDDLVISALTADKNTTADYPTSIDGFTAIIMMTGEATVSIDMQNYSIKPKIAEYLILAPKSFVNEISRPRCRSTCASARPRAGGHAAGWTKSASCCMLRSDKERYRHEIIRTLFTTAFYIITEINQREQPGEMKQGRCEVLFDEFMSLLQQYNKKERNVSFYAKQLNITPKYLSSVVKEVSGKTAARWIDESVILEAKALLKYSGMSIQEIAYHLNFSTQSFFGKYFKQHTGTSPSRYKRKG